MKKNDVFISPLEDFAFKQIFGEKRNIDNTKAFLTAVLNIPGNEIGKLTVVNPVLRRFFRKDKSGIVDIKLEAKSGKIFHIELQVEKKANMRSRILYYGARLIGDQLKWGEDYRKLHHVVSIVICDHVLLDEESSYMNIYELKNDRNKSFTDLFKVVIIELPKLPETEDENNKIWRWLRFLKCKKKEEYEMLARKYPELKKPVHCVRRMGLIESIRDYYFHRNLAKIDDLCLKEQWMIDGRAEGIAQGMAEGKEIGISEGMARGIAEGKISIARNLLTKGSTLEFISEVTGLSIEQIEKL